MPDLTALTSPTALPSLTEAQTSIAKLRGTIASVYLGNTLAIDQLLVCLLARGHCLIEDVPGVGKTVLATALAKGINCSFSRIQLTPDLLPSDILGVSIYRRELDHFEFKRGPIFANVVLADEINRATPRAQSALLEAMSDAAVTVDGITHRLEPPFMLVATQNPSEFEGTYSLPENQLDRFLMRVSLGYPTAEVESSVLVSRPAKNALPQLAPALDVSDVLALQTRTDNVRLDPAIVRYIVALATATRNHESLALGVSPRGSLALSLAARATAVLAGRDYTVPDDVVKNVVPVWAHRIISTTGNDARRNAPVLLGILSKVPSPV